MKIMFSAGEASGDTHGASVAKALKERFPNVEMLGMGGQKMEEAGVRIVYNIDKLGFIGVVEILKALPKFFKLRTYLKEIMIREKPDVFVCIDYPGFNMKMAKVAHELGIPVLYYICPTIWAWHRSRGYDIAKYTDKVACIFPFEAKAYEEFDVDVNFVGHPLLDIVKAEETREETMDRLDVDKDAFRLMLLPGSRLQEVNGLLDIMLEAVEEAEKTHASIQVFLPRAHTIPRELLEEKIANHNVNVTITEGRNYDLMAICDAAIAASGTATLETAIMDLPTILVYKVSPLTYAIGKRVVKIPYVGLPNIVAGREVIPELIQKEATSQNVARELSKLMDDSAYYKEMKESLRQVTRDLGGSGAVERVATLIGEMAMVKENNEGL